MKCKKPDCQNMGEGYYIGDLEVCQSCCEKKCEIEDCEAEEEGYMLDDLNVCLGCYSDAQDHAYEVEKDRQIMKAAIKYG